MQKKVALVTCYFQHNFGSQLQAYATQLLFDKLGIKNETICIDGLKREINKAKYKYFLSKIFDGQVVADKLSTVKKLLAKIFKRDYALNMNERNDAFRLFEKEKFHLSRVFKSKRELKKYAYDYSAFVVGSDQLWLPSNIEADYYTLNFVPTDICKISVSTSFGVASLPNKQAKKAKTFLNRFDYISVREKTGQSLVKKITGKDATVVCDPTLMFSSDEWSCQLPVERYSDEPYIFCYFLGNNPEQREWVKKVKKETGFKIIQLQHCDEYIKSDESFPDEAPFHVGPIEFVQLIRDAEFVFTDSFHCSVFSILFEKKFFVFRRYSKDSIVSTNGRIYSLLSQVELEGRLLYATESVEKKIVEDINYSIVKEKLSDLRAASYAWLCSCLKDKGIV